MVQPLYPLPPPGARLPLRERGTFEEIVRRAAADVRGQGWEIVRQRAGADNPWHIVARRAQKLRVIQVVSPAARSADLAARRTLLGETVRLPHAQGVMEQWLAHVRPNGHISFGPYVLNAPYAEGGEGAADPRSQLGLDDTPAGHGA